MVTAFALILGMYCLLLVILLVGWSKVKKEVTTGTGKIKAGISIVVACRNEETRLDTLIKSLVTLDYPPENFEIIFVDDHSTDKTLAILEEKNLGRRNISVLRLPEGSEGKKSALSYGIEKSKFKIIATTDADCRVPADWLSYLSLFFEEEKIKMLVGGVKLTGTSFFSQLQSMEFSSLVGATAAAIGLTHPIMCNGANLAFRKESFREVSGYEGNFHIASGDDEFLMRKIFRQHPGSIRFLHFPEAVVSSTAQIEIYDFISQRLRWAGKWRDNADGVTRILAVFILIAQIAFLTLSMASVVQPGYLLVLVGLKILLEFFFIFSVVRFTRARFNLFAFVALQIIYPMYVIVIGFLSWTGPIGGRTEIIKMNKGHAEVIFL